MKKLTTTLAAIVLTTVSGCATYRPNTQKGWHLDEINKHTRRISVLDPVIYEQNEQVLPQRMTQIGDTLSWQERMKARMSGMKGAK